MIGIVFVAVSIVTDALDDQPGDQRMTTHDQTESCSLHVGSNRATYWCSHILEGIIGSHGVARGHSLDIATNAVPFESAFRWGLRTAQTPDVRLSNVE